MTDDDLIVVTNVETGESVEMLPAEWVREWSNAVEVAATLLGLEAGLSPRQFVTAVGRKTRLPQDPE
ncbi:MAG: hypothetical protein AAGI08_00115 [Bacteroidota bacterium]